MINVKSEWLPLYMFLSTKQVYCSYVLSLHWCSIKTFIQDTYFFLLWNLGLFWQEFWAIYGKPIWIMLYKYSKIELKPSLELRWAHCWGFGKHHCSCLLPEWWNFTMHYVSIIEIYLKNCIKTIFSQANKDKV